MKGIIQEEIITQKAKTVKKLSNMNIQPEILISADKKWINDNSMDVSSENESGNVRRNISNDTLFKKQDEKIESCALDKSLGEFVEDPYEFQESDSEVGTTQNISIGELIKKYDVVKGACILDITVEEKMSVNSFVILQQNNISLTEENKEKHLKNMPITPDERTTPNENKSITPDIDSNNNDFSSMSFETIDDDRDKDFILDNYLETSSSSGSFIDDGAVNICHGKNVDNKIDNTENLTVSNIKEQILSRENDPEVMEVKRENKLSWCPFCSEDVLSKNYVRHMKRMHKEEKEIKSLLSLPKKTKERRMAFDSFRKQTNFDLYINGTVRPQRQTTDFKLSAFYPCIYCKALIKKSYLTRHSLVCSKKGLKTNAFNQENHRNYLTDSQTLTACSIDPTNVISRLAVKEQVFNIMKADKIAFEAKKDLLIVQFGDNYLKKHKRERKEYACSNRMRELSRLLIAFRETVNDNSVFFKDLIKPQNVDQILTAARKISGYDPVERTFNAPSLATHMGTYLKDMCCLLKALILKGSSGFCISNEEEREKRLRELNHFNDVITSSWNNEISSLANKDLQEKRWNKPLLVPLVSDIKKFRDETLNLAKECEEKFKNCVDDVVTYKTFVHCVLGLVILFNRRRIGDVQYLKVQNYERESRSNFTDFKKALTDSENALTTKYKRVVNSGKGSRAVVILVPELLQKLIKILLEERKKYISLENNYVFAIPDSKIKWGQGDVAIRFLTKRIDLQYPEAMSSNKLRKQIATVAQILNMSKEESRQFSKFMGHTEKTHAEFYELPVDLYQTAKVSKLLMLMERGSLPVEYQGKSLAEIDFNANLEYAEECAEGEKHILLY
ncbi:uncharacterized protein LOC122499596 [Leptopilina heterotoma]|uniref:uncharacterized protein LOC122499596 n=1 Tax=Leptopilina heterotoma TaxID=63436 RepID=UPI001CA9C81B|nr:uncharacterized protein LOC122499596 [Leptopilina heterotoma]